MEQDFPVPLHPDGDIDFRGAAVLVQNMLLSRCAAASADTYVGWCTSCGVEARADVSRRLPLAAELYSRPFVCRACGVGVVLLERERSLSEVEVVVTAELRVEARPRS